ncbi:hypothetical protein BD779DRAFT_1468023 [Infundibulicybe gibba]|nr:hypothetical protein BD779DRAFT_1468023 [Infundibulicybe gibba]
MSPDQRTLQQQRCALITSPPPDTITGSAPTPSYFAALRRERVLVRAIVSVDGNLTPAIHVGCIEVAPGIMSSAGRGTREGLLSHIHGGKARSGSENQRGFWRTPSVCAHHRGCPEEVDGVMVERAPHARMGWDTYLSRSCWGPIHGMNEVGPLAPVGVTDSRAQQGARQKRSSNCLGMFLPIQPALAVNVIASRRAYRGAPSRRVAPRQRRPPGDRSFGWEISWVMSSGGTTVFVDASGVVMRVSGWVPERGRQRQARQAPVPFGARAGNSCAVGLSLARLHPHEPHPASTTMRLESGRLCKSSFLGPTHARTSGCLSPSGTEEPLLKPPSLTPHEATPKASATYRAPLRRKLQAAMKIHGGVPRFACMRRAGTSVDRTRNDGAPAREKYIRAGGRCTWDGAPAHEGWKGGAFIFIQVGAFAYTLGGVGAGGQRRWYSCSRLSVDS